MVNGVLRVFALCFRGVMFRTVFFQLHVFFLAPSLALRVSDVGEGSWLFSNTEKPGKD